MSGQSTRPPSAPQGANCSCSVCGNPLVRRPAHLRTREKFFCPGCNPKKKLPLKSCQVCGEAFRPRHARNRFCSRACGVLGRSGPSRKASAVPNVQCAYCGKPLWRKPSTVRKRERFYCSLPCKDAHQKTLMAGADNHNYRGAGWKVCEGCGDRFKSYNSSRRFCGVSCSQRLNKNEYLTNARRGREAEKMCADELASRGYLAFRSAGSRGPFDVIGINRQEILLVQVGRTKNHARRRLPKKLRQLMRAVCPDSPIIRRQLWAYVDGSGWTVTEVGDDKPDTTDPEGTPAPGLFGSGG